MGVSKYISACSQPGPLAADGHGDPRRHHHEGGGGHQDEGAGGVGGEGQGHRQGLRAGCLRWLGGSVLALSVAVCALRMIARASCPEREACKRACDANALSAWYEWIDFYVWLDCVV